MSGVRQLKTLYQSMETMEAEGQNTKLYEEGPVGLCSAATSTLKALFWCHLLILIFCKFT